MAKGKPESNWKKYVLAWKASGKNCKAWCRENKISHTTFYGWKNRFEKLDKLKAASGFIELKEKTPIDSGIIMECGGVKIHLKSEFDAIALQRCLSSLRGALC